MVRKTRKYILPALLGATLLAVPGYQGRAAAVAQAAPAARTTVTPLKIAKSATLGRILINKHGMTVYIYKPDHKNASVCTGQCAKYWPPLLVKKSVHLSKGNLPGTLHTIVRSNGARQVTYNGWPLYLYVGDKKPGEVTGQGVQGVWYAATPKIAPAT